MRRGNMAPTQPAPAGASAERLRLAKRCKQGQAGAVSPAPAARRPPGARRPPARCSGVDPSDGLSSWLVLGPFGVSGGLGSAAGMGRWFSPQPQPASAQWDHGVPPRLAALEGQVHSGRRLALMVRLLGVWAPGRSTPSSMAV